MWPVIVKMHRTLYCAAPTPFLGGRGIAGAAVPAVGCSCNTISLRGATAGTLHFTVLTVS